MSHDTRRLLAILGGTPAFAEPLHVGRPNLGNQERFVERLNGVWERRRFTNDGPLVREFEERIAALLHVRHCIAVCNGTVALELASRALELTKEVIVPALTFAATAQFLLWQGLTPVFCEVDPQSHTLDPQQVESLITEKTSGIVGVHLWGNPCDIPRLQAIADRHELKLLFDAAHALGCAFDGQPIGGFGNAEVLSFHATKFLHCGEGGAIVTNDDALARELRLLRNFGFAGLDHIARLGTNGKMSELNAALGLTSLESLDEFLTVNRRNHQRYAETLAGLPGVKLSSVPDEAVHNRQYVVVSIDDEVCPLTRDELLDVLHAENILARRYFYPGCHQIPPFRELPQCRRGSLEITDRLCRTLMQLPTGTAVSERDIETISNCLVQAVENAPEVRKTMTERSRQT